MFVDSAQINVRGGDGGAGCASFHKEAHKVKGGPDGGDGGRGGDVVLIADPSVSTLIRFTREIHFRAVSGAHGTSKRMHGRTGADLEVRVPPGTTVRDRDGEIVADLVQPGESAVIARGGRGGKGNARFLSNERRAPGFAEQGEYGEERWLHLELRLLADVALVGFPNAGKSTLISVVSSARPKIADYPFTTLVPHLGVASVGDTDIVIADIPGLIEGAAEGRGLGHQFLRHVERARVLVLLLDPLNPTYDMETQRAVLVDELRSYQPELLDRPRLTLVTKIDAAPGSRVPGAMAVSAATHSGIREFLGECARLVEDAREAAPVLEGFVVHRPRQEGLAVRRGEGGDGWIVEGDAAARAVAMADLTNPEALVFAQGKLRRLGVDSALAAAGARRGDEIHIGEFVFEYEPDDDGSEGSEGADGSAGHRLAGGGRKRGRRSA